MNKTFVIGLLSIAILVLTACADKDDPLYYNVSIESVNQITAGSAIINGSMDTNDQNADAILIINGATLVSESSEVMIQLYQSELLDLEINVDFLKANTDYTFTLAFSKDGEKHRGNSYSFTSPAETPVIFSELQAFNYSGPRSILQSIITNTGGAAIQSYGFWLATAPGLDESQGVYYEHETESDDFHFYFGSYNLIFDNLTPNTTYYARSYAIKDMGISFGEEISFTTLSY